MLPVPRGRFDLRATVFGRRHACSFDSLVSAGALCAGLPSIMCSFDLISGPVIETIPMGRGPHGVAPCPGTNTNPSDLNECGFRNESEPQPAVQSAARHPDRLRDVLRSEGSFCSVRFVHEQINKVHARPNATRIRTLNQLSRKI